MASVLMSQPEIRYHKIGDKVVEQDTATVNWSASNANSARIEPFDSNALSGSRTVIADPKQTSMGPINESRTFTFTATNACGGADHETATLHVVGSIDPPPLSATLLSVFDPTAYPTKRHPKAGLVASEKLQLMEIAAHFKNYEPYDHKGTLMIVAHADIRGPKPYNQALSERRAALIKDFLVAQGVPADKIKVRPEGKQQQLAESQVKVLLSHDPRKARKVGDSPHENRLARSL